MKKLYLSLFLILSINSIAFGDSINIHYKCELRNDFQLVDWESGSFLLERLSNGSNGDRGALYGAAHQITGNQGLLGWQSEIILQKTRRNVSQMRICSSIVYLSEDGFKSMILSGSSSPNLCSPRIGVGEQFTVAKTGASQEGGLLYYQCTFTPSFSELSIQTNRQTRE